MDRGRKSLECLKFVNSLPDDRKILIHGNHESLLQDCLDRGYCLSHDDHNGTTWTVGDLGYYGAVTDMDEVFKLARKNSEWIKYRNSLVDYAEVGNSIFVHGWIPCFADDSNKYHARDIKYTFDENWRDGDWDAARWINGMNAWSQGVKIEGKVIYMGHWHTSWGHSKLHKLGPEWDNKYSTNPEHRKAHFEPFVDEGIVALDACTAYSHKVNVVVLED